MKILWGVLVAVLTSGGCAGIDVRPLTTIERANEQDPDKASELRGIRFFRSSAYLLVRQTGSDGSCDVTIAYYQNVDEPYILIPQPGIGSITFTPTLTDGWNLTGFSGTVDSKVSEMIAAAATVAAAAVAAAVPAEKPEQPTSRVELNNTEMSVNEPLGPGMYKMTFGKDGATFKRAFAVKLHDGSFQSCSRFASSPAPPPAQKLTRQPAK
jgi:hypothetical protein